MANYITRAEGVYVTLNEINPALLACAYNRLADRLKPTTGDADVLRRRIFYVDVDPVRPAQISATDAEHALALARARQISAVSAGAGARRRRSWPTAATAAMRCGALICRRTTAAWCRTRCGRWRCVSAMRWPR